MSSIERNKGRLVPITMATVEKVAERMVTELDTRFHLTKKDQFLYDIAEYGYQMFDGQLYRVEWDVEGETDCMDFADVVKDKSGVIHFHTLHYNGGGHWTEVVESELKKSLPACDD